MHPQKNKVTLLLADDHPVVLKGLNQIVSSNFPDCLIEEVTSMHELEVALASGIYTHLVLDLNLNDGTVLSLLPELIIKYPLLYILIYSMASENIYGQKLFELNVSGFLSKTANVAEVIQALRIFLEGGYYASKSLRLKMNTNKGGETNIFSSLSIMELKVLGDILKGSRPKEIAAALNVKPQTITTYKARIFEKLGTNNIVEIQRLADIYSVNLS